MSGDKQIPQASLHHGNLSALPTLYTGLVWSYLLELI